jgi:hypothetical protein
MNIPNPNLFSLPALSLKAAGLSLFPPAVYMDWVLMPSMPTR